MSEVYTLDRTKQMVKDNPEVAPEKLLNDFGRKLDEASTRYLNKLTAQSAAPQDSMIAAAPELETVPFVDPMPEVPAFLKNIPNWIHWKLENDTKVPYRVDGRKAASTRPEDWTDYRTAVSGVTIDKNGGVGFVVDKGIVGIDLDGCYDEKTDTLTQWAQDIMDAVDSYTEYTPSGNGARVWVRGTLPDGPKVFNLDPAAGYGDKVKIEVFTDSRYFTVTGQSCFDSTDVEERDLTAVYQMFHDIRGKYPVKSTKTIDSSASAPSESAKVEKFGFFDTSKFDVLMNGKIVSDKPFVVANDYGRVTDYPSHSEAELGLATILAIKHNGDAQKIDEDFRRSALMRDKWERSRQYTIPKAIETAAKLTMNQKYVEPSVANNVDGAASSTNNPVLDADEKASGEIPPFDPTVMTGFFKEVVDAVCDGTTIPPQFVYLAMRVYAGTYVSRTLKMDGVEGDTCIYGAAIGPTGTSKGLSWRRSVESIFQTIFEKNLWVFEPDSGAGVRDVFFHYKCPAVMFIDEMLSLANKADGKKQPEIVDRIIELANKKSISRTKAKHGKFGGSQSAEARMGFYGCAQSEEVFRTAFAGKKKQGIDERFDFEMSGPILPGKLPTLSAEVVTALRTKFIDLTNPMRWANQMQVTPEAEKCLDDFWNGLSKTEQNNVRLPMNLRRDAHLQAWSRGSSTVELEDAVCVVRYARRGIAIRRKVTEGQDTPNRVGFFISKLKASEWEMHRRCVKGVAVRMVLKSYRDFMTEANAYRENEEGEFYRAWNTVAKTLFQPVTFQAKNGRVYTKFAPLPLDDEVWDWSGTTPAEWRSVLL